jgi:hypothetical protein
MNKGARLVKAREGWRVITDLPAPIEEYVWPTKREAQKAMMTWLGGSEAIWPGGKAGRGRNKK